MKSQGNEAHLMPIDNFAGNNLLKRFDRSSTNGDIALKHDIWLGSWRVAVKGSSTGGAVVISEGGHLSLKWPPTLKRLRIEQIIDTSNLHHEPKGHTLSLRIDIGKGHDFDAPIEWAALLASNLAGSKSGFVFVHTFEFDREETESGTTLRASVHMDHFDADRIYQFCIQLKPEGRQLSLGEIEMVADPITSLEKLPDMTHQKVDLVASNTDSPEENHVRPGAPSLGVRKKAIIIAWDMGHNPVGRAFLLADMLAQDYDVELIGPQFDKYGTDVWAPVRQSSLPFRTFPASTMSDFVANSVAFVQECRPDVVIACKARLPSMFLSLLIKHACGCPVLIDVDDHELSFFKNRDPLPLAELIKNYSTFDDLDLPYGETWTRVCETLIDHFDGIIVSNASLQDRFGGLVVRHARDEKLFFRNPVVRETTRAEFGFSPDDKVILFLGTPRAHKGIFRIAEAMERIKDPNLVLCIVGSSNDKRIDKMLESFKDARINSFPDQPWERLNELVNMADGVCLLQDPESPIAEYQIPAKLTDALATGVPVAVTNVAPFRDIPSPQILFRVNDDNDLDGFLNSVASGQFDTHEYRTRVRQYFIGEMGYAVNTARLKAISEFASQGRSPWQTDWTRLFRFIERHWKVALQSRVPEWSSITSGFPALKLGAKFDVAFFWKQNDTGIYGRRHDMVLKYLAKHPRVGKIIQFDAPVTPRDLSARVRLDGDASLDQGNLVVNNTIRRFMKIADSANVARRVFMHRGGYQKDNFLGQDLPALDDYPSWVENNIKELGSRGPVVSWVTPIARGYPSVHDYVNFDYTVADLIDDQRTMTEPAARERAHNSYVDMQDRADIFFANCESLRDSFSFLGRKIAVVPNAAEHIAWPKKIVKPYELLKFEGKIVGYVGNLRDRIDVELIGELALQHPEWNIVLIGSAHGKTDVLTLRCYPNIHFLGVKPYEEALNYIRAFDVAIMPHLDNEVSKSMNPLKLYVYLSAGVPIVTTSVSNIDDVTPFASVAINNNDFIARVEQVLAGSYSVRREVELPKDICWEARVECMIQHIDATL